MADLGPGLAALVVRRRRWVLAVWIVITAALAPAASRVERDLDVSALVAGSESARVDELLRDRFASPFARYAVLVVTRAPSPATPAGDTLLRAIVDRVGALPGVTKTLSYLDTRDSLFVPTGSRGGGTFVIVGIDAAVPRPDSLVPHLRAATRAFADSLPVDGTVLQWTGDLVLNHDIRLTSAHEAQRAERQVMPLTLLLLVIAFGALVASLLPLAVAVAAITAALGGSVLIAAHTPLSILLQNVVTMLGLGLGIDYALLMVSRFREELSAGYEPEVAAVRATREAGHTILLSAAAVLIGFAALLFIPLNELQAVAVGGSLVVIGAALTAVGPLPGLLAMLGPRVNAGRLWPAKWRDPSRPSRAADRWRRWGTFVAAHPWPVLIMSAAPLIALALPLRRIDVTLPRANWLPAGMESARALDSLNAIGAGGVVHELRAVVELPDSMRVFDDVGWAAVRRVERILSDDPRVARVQSITSILPVERPDPAALAFVPAAVFTLTVSTDGRAAVIEVVPRSTDDFQLLTNLARDLRRRASTDTALPPGTRVSIGGLPAFNADYEDAIAGRFPIVVALVVCGTLIALLLGFRSVLVPLKAIALNLLSVAAALGLVVLVFQDGHGVRLFGLPGAMGSLFPALPALVFCIVFGLSMDYEVFLVARVREAWRAGLSDGDALAEGLARTGGVITSAASIMVVVFAGFTLGGFVMIKILGFALAAAVLIDVTIVRIALGPALLRLAGRWNWWPAKPARTADADGDAERRTETR